MKNTFLKILILLFFSNINMVWATKFGPDIILECPKYNALLIEKTFISGNTFNARFWTDGYILAPMMPKRPWLVKCPNCKTLIWLDEAKKIGEERAIEKEKMWPNALIPSIPLEADYLSILNSNQLSKKKEKYIRINIWWDANEIIRMNPDETFKFTQEQERNIEILTNLLDEKNLDELIMKAEIFRELGIFDKCLLLLEQSSKNDNYILIRESAELIKNLAINNYKNVTEIKYKKNKKK